MFWGCHSEEKLVKDRSEEGNVNRRKNSIKGFLITPV
jgi:hypothetical protein